jgi:lipoprotein signal peptidase
VIDVLAAGGMLLFLDQWSKNVVQSRYDWRIVRIRRVLHTKRLYESRRARLALVVLWFVASVSAILLYRSGAQFHSHTALVGLGSAFGGAAGNLLDIMRRRYVVDFIDFGWWPVFNFADVGIVAGLVLAFLFQG